MSTSYWLIQGVGLDTDKIYSYLDRNKVIKKLREELPDDDVLKEIIRTNGELDIDEFLYGNPYENLAHLLTRCDDTDTLTYGDDGEGGSYFYYPPSMPWQLGPNDPHSIEEVHRRVVRAIEALTTLSHDEIEAMIDDDLYVVGMG